MDKKLAPPLPSPTPPTHCPCSMSGHFPRVSLPATLLAAAAAAKSLQSCLILNLAS